MIDIDLAFDPAPEAVIQSSDDAAVRGLLQAPDHWVTELGHWVAALREQTPPACPDSVRNAESISLGLQLTDDDTIAELNGQWRKKPQPTDVLSFAALEDAPLLIGEPCVELGDIIVSVPTARRQAEEHGHDLHWELRWLVSHGFLHLLGWDHPDDHQLAAMVHCQEQLLNDSGKVLGEEGRGSDAATTQVTPSS